MPRLAARPYTVRSWGLSTLSGSFKPDVMALACDHTPPVVSAYQRLPATSPARLTTYIFPASSMASLGSLNEAASDPVAQLLRFCGADHAPPDVVATCKSSACVTWSSHLPAYTCGVATKATA